MRGCFVGLGAILLYKLFIAVCKAIGFLLLLMVTSVSSLFVGVDVAINRISFSWIEQATGSGVLLGYNQVTRGGVKVAAGLLLGLGWLMDIGVIVLVASLIINS